jgi:predicted GNAT family N-acyltransferase
LKQHFQIRSITAEETQPVRYQVLWPHLPDVKSCVIDIDHAPHAHHIGAFDPNGKLVGVCSLFQQRSERFPEAIALDVSVYRLRVMGTLKEVRGQGAAASIIDYVCQWCTEQGVKCIWCDARQVAFGFYERLGFEFVSEDFNIERIGLHRMMARSL